MIPACAVEVCTEPRAILFKERWLCWECAVPLNIWLNPSYASTCVECGQICVYEAETADGKTGDFVHHRCLQRYAEVRKIREAAGADTADVEPMGPWAS